MTQAWHNRSQYGVIIRSLIKKQYATYNRSKDAHIKIKLAHNISNLINTQNGLLNDRYNDMNYDQELLSMVEQITDNQKERQKLLDKMQRQKELKEREKYYDDNTKKMIAQQRKAGLIA